MTSRNDLVGEPWNDDTDETPGYFPDEKDGPQFHQYLIAIGAIGDPPREELAKTFHDVGMEFAQRVGLEPLLCVGYVSEVGHQPDYLAAAKVWHTFMGDLDHESLRNALPKLYVALTLLFGQPTPIGAQKG